MDRYQPQKIIKIPENLVIYKDEELKKSAFCELCYSLLQPPILVCSSCNFYGCQDCINQQQKYNRGKCPKKCTTNKISFQSKHLPILHTVLDKIEVKCPNSQNQQVEDQCQEILNYNQIYKHIQDDCRYQLIMCKHMGCKKLIRKEIYVEHQQNCEFKIFQCKLCMDFFKKDEYQKHDCDYKIIKCDFPECKAEVQKYLINKHYQKDCQYVQHKCKYCGIQKVKWQILKHQETCDAKLVNCQGCKKKMILKELKDHENICNLITVECQNCQIQLTRQQLQTHNEKQCIQELKRLLTESQQENYLNKQQIQELNQQFEQLDHQFMKFVGLSNKSQIKFGINQNNFK